jgi:hypothetical protein
MMIRKLDDAYPTRVETETAFTQSVEDTSK